MKLKLSIGLIPLIISVNAFSAEGSGVYISAKTGISLFRSLDNHVYGSGNIANALSYDVEKENLKNSSTTNFSPNIAIGYKFANEFQQPVRVELAYQYFGSDKSSANIEPSAVGYWSPQQNDSFPLPAKTSFSKKTTVNTLMVNTYYDMPVNEYVSPYIMAGVGAAFLKNSANMQSNVAGQDIQSHSTSNKTNLAWALGTGVSWKVNENISIETGYTYTDVGNIKNSLTGHNGINANQFNSNTKPQLHTLFAGASYYFK
ncbi:outer membrane protein [Providencia burhodogranariea]|uniref:Adhesin/invasin protein PagN n=1 Tax=Providencia burhodogranariea DSM 19968 TaxID=1141662 RepID=K8WQP2_9GAMM|nr:adhesin/invasin protein PagN [Providencia burhodogranariea DSM 19968]